MRFYFDVKDSSFSRDDIGTDLADRYAARAEALAVLGPIAEEVLPDDQTSSISVTVRDADRRPIFHASLALVEDWLD